LQCDLARYDPFSADVLSDPYPWYRALRDDAACRHVEKHDLYVVSRFDDVVACARNHAVFSSTGGVGPVWEQRPMMPMYDPPLHTRLRRLVSKPFQPNAVAERTVQIQAAVDRLVTQAIDRRSFDLVEDVAVPLSLGVIASLLGVPEQRLGDLRRWSLGVVEDLAGGLDKDGQARVEQQRKEFVTYLRGLVAERKAEGSKASDVISLILDAAEDEQLTEKETIAFCVLLLVAGFETTVNAIANGILAFVEHPDQWAKLRERPQLVKLCAEEMVRYDDPVQSFFRNTMVETEIGGVRIPHHKKVMLIFASGNRDERHFPNPDVFDIERHAPDHLGYGIGVHYCLGAPLARAQLTTLFSAFATRLRTFEISGEVVRSGSVLFRGARNLPLTVDPV
jgi:cytochrome P450